MTAAGTRKPPSKILTGDFFQDTDQHPAICLGRSPSALHTISLIDGSTRKLPLDSQIERHILSLDEAIRLRIFGPKDAPCTVSRFWWREDRIDPVAINYASLTSAPARLPTDQNPMLLRGDLYEGLGSHPCICLWILDEGARIGGISLVDGSCPAFPDLSSWTVLKLTPAEAWSWRQHGPQGIDPEDSRPRADDVHADRRWWQTGGADVG